jgi:hypothetical protein
MTILKFALLLMALLCGCEPSSPVFDRKPIPPDADISKDRNEPKSPKHGNDRFTQDLNKSYNEIKGRWVHAIPLNEYNKSNPSIIINE